MAGTYQDLKVWQLAMEMFFQVYRCTEGFPKQEIYGLTSQMRRSAVSVPSNIAEGKGRFSRKELVHYLFQAWGSLLELETQILIARKLEYLDDFESKRLIALTSEVGRPLNGLVNSFQSQLKA